MSSRTRTTWAAASRRASAPPADPGYGKEDQDHPAHKPDPAQGQYAKGDPEAWAEGVHKPPYPQGNAPADPGYGSEDQDHPAHKKMPAVPKEANLKQLVSRKASKCLKVARAMLGPKAKQAAVEDQALDLMDMPEQHLNATYQRLSGGFLADQKSQTACFDDMDPGVDPVLDVPDFDDPVLDPVMDDDGDFDGDFFAGMEDGQVPPAMKQMYAMMRQMQAKLNTLTAKKAEGDEGEEEAPAEDKPEEESGDKKAARSLFASLDTDRDGFIMAEDWSNKAMFAAIDTDADGIVAADEFVAAFGGSQPKQSDAFGHYAELDEDELAMLRALDDGDKQGCGDVMASKKAKKADDEDKSEEDKPEVAGKKAKKAEGEDEDEGESDEDESEVAGKKAKKAEGEDDESDEGDPEDESEAEGDESESAEDEGEDKTAGDESDEGEAESEEDEDSGKEAAAYFDAGGADPMGLSGGDGLTLSAADQQMLDAIFNEGLTASQVPNGETRVEASLKPKPKKAAQGVKTLGNMARTASASAASVDELSKLWETAPDVSKVFNM